MNPQIDRSQHRLPNTDGQYHPVRYYVEDQPVAEYTHASPAAYEAFRDIKYGIRIHWGLYTLMEIEASWALITHFDNAQRQAYQQLYQQFNPKDFDADRWMQFFADNGLKMFAFTTKHHDGFSLFKTKTRVKSRANWTAPGGPVIEPCDLAYGIQDSPFKRDIVGELCDAAHKRDIKIDLYYTHPDWYDADFRGFGLHPIQTPEYRAHPDRYGNGQGSGHLEPPVMMGPDPTDAELARMMQRYRDQLTELLTHYGKIDMICFDIWLGPKVWPQLRQILIDARKLQPDVMFRARGIGNYGDYYTPEDVVPGAQESTNVPWFVVHRLGRYFSYDPDGSTYRSGKWIIDTLIDIVAKGGNLMVSAGPDRDGHFHPKAIEALEEVGAWLKVNGKAIYDTRPRPGDRWREGIWIVYTASKDGRFVYALTNYWPGKTMWLYTVAPRPGSKIRMLGVDQPLSWRRDGNRLEIDIPQNFQDPAHRPCAHAWAFQIEAST